MTKKIDAVFQSEETAGLFEKRLAETYKGIGYKIDIAGHVVEGTEFSDGRVKKTIPNDEYVIKLEINDELTNNIKSLIENSGGKVNEG